MKPMEETASVLEHDHFQTASRTPFSCETVAQNCTTTYLKYFLHGHSLHTSSCLMLLLALLPALLASFSFAPFVPCIIDPLLARCTLASRCVRAFINLISLLCYPPVIVHDLWGCAWLLPPSTSACRALMACLARHTTTCAK